MVSRRPLSRRSLNAQPLDADGGRSSPGADIHHVASYGGEEGLHSPELGGVLDT